MLQQARSDFRTAPSRKATSARRGPLGCDPFAEPIDPRGLEKRIEALLAARRAAARAQRRSGGRAPRALAARRLLGSWGRLLSRWPRRRASARVQSLLVALALLGVGVGSMAAGFWVGREIHAGDGLGPLAGADEVVLPTGWAPDASPQRLDGIEPDAAAGTLADVVPEPEEIRGEIAAGGTLSAALLDHGVPALAVAVLEGEVRPFFDFHHAHAGDRYTLLLTPDGEVLEFRYGYSPTESVRVTRVGDGYVAAREEAALIPRHTRVGGVISTSLYDAVVDAGEPAQIAVDFVDIFAWDVDFSRAVQPGDAFGILYERLYREDIHGARSFVGPGRILAARYAGAAGTHAAVWFQTGPDQGGYYRPDGSSVQRQFLVAPLEYRRISSQYTVARRHPILKVTRPHLGIDYAAAAGSQVWAVADGVVTHRGWAGGFGRLVKIRHPNGYESFYAHLSRYVGGVRVGDHVTQKQVIGYVGQSGLATGPHVCFRIAKDGRFVNPGELHMPAGEPIPSDELDHFLLERDALFLQLEATSNQIPTLEAL